MKASVLTAAITILMSGVGWCQSAYFTADSGRFQLTLRGAQHLASLPLRCITQEFPYKTGIVYTDSHGVKPPRSYHPVFFGCFDWHSSAHGHWMLIRLMRMFPGLPQSDTIRTILRNQLTASHIKQEMALFSGKENKAFERTYGWAWILQMQMELDDWPDTLAKTLADNLRPLSLLFAELYKDYLSKLVYPIRTGEHSNLAFGLRLGFDYAKAAGDTQLIRVITKTAREFYSNDVACPLNYEPGGTDFLSPCLEEADLMWRILPRMEYDRWLSKFLPELRTPGLSLQPGEVKDRTDGRLVHLDGLNFSRAWCLMGIADHVLSGQDRLLALAQLHLEAALPWVATGDYMGEHWLASFAVYALTLRRN